MVTKQITAYLIRIAETGRLNDRFIRFGIRTLLRQRLGEIKKIASPNLTAYKSEFIDMMSNSSVAIKTDLANEQHYEVTSEFFKVTLGKHLKYSCCFYDKKNSELDEAEKRAIEITLERAQLMDGQDILELGCGWGSLSLYMAQQYPNSNITAISNSSSQKDFIDQEVEKLSLQNLKVITADMSSFQIDKQFDRIISVEMFEHMRNYRVLYERISRWLKPEGLFFKHIFTHRDTPYQFQVKSDSDWMSRYFFSGGMMPSADLPSYFNEHLELVNQWQWNGWHYARTCDDWLKKTDQHKSKIISLFNETYGHDKAHIWFNRWRIFYMSCAELFAFNNGREWLVSHYLMRRKS
jgi:cyclopropane-fatty-acyl-phospholipid synthase